MTAEFGGRRAVLIFLALLAIALIPVASTDIPPLFDYPNHLARMAILAADGHKTLLEQYYAVRWAPLPNLAMDALVPALSRAMPLLMAGRLFVVAVFILLAGGIMLLYRAAWGRWSWWSCLGFLLLYNRILLWGFLNYLFGLGLALCVTALWLILAKKPSLRLILVPPLALLVFFSHLAAFGILGLMLCGCEIAPAWKDLRHRSWRNLIKRSASLGACFIVPIVIFMLWQPHAPSGIAYGHFWRKADLLFSVFDNYHRGFDTACFVLALGVIIAGAYWGKIHPRLGGAAALLALAYIAVPDTLFTGAGADHRLPLGIFAALIPAIRPKPLPLPWAKRIIGFGLTLFVARLAVIEPVWLAADGGYRHDLAILAAIPEGSRLAIASPESAVRVSVFPQVHFPALAIAFRQALVPTLFTYKAQQPVAFRPSYDTIAKASRPALFWNALMEKDAAAMAPAATLLSAYDDIVFVDDKAFKVAPNSCLEPLGATSTFQLYRILHHAESCQWRVS